MTWSNAAKHGLGIDSPDFRSTYILFSSSSLKQTSVRTGNPAIEGMCLKKSRFRYGKADKK